MKHFGKKLLAAVISVAMAVPVGNVFGTTASAEEFFQGDSNGDGRCSMSDLIWINKYINGMGSANGITLARMDCNYDYAITLADVNVLQSYLLNTGMVLTSVTRNVLTEPYNVERTYLKYDVESNAESEYTLSAVPYLTPASSRDIVHDEDEENDNIVQLVIEGIPTFTGTTTGTGTGFIVDDHVIATAAHNLMNMNTGEFFDVTVNICNDEGTAPYYPIDPVEYHVPKLFRTSVGEYRLGRCNYDYALIYVEEDLSQYGLWSLGVPTDEFMNTNRNVSVSGFCNVNGTYRRYVSTGPIDNLGSVYRLRSDALSQPGKSGGPIYITSPVNGEDVKTVIAINTDSDKDANYNSTNSYGARMTPAIIQFYLENINIG